MATVLVVGAGPVGCATALALYNKGYQVSIHESRKDPRKNPEEGLRSVNLAVSARGMNTLRRIGPQIANRVSNFFVPMKGRMIHGFDYTKSVQYGLYGEEIYSISRFTLNYLLLEEAKLANIPIHFESSFERYDGQFAVFSDEKVECDFIVGADGTFSKVRQAMMRLDDFNYDQAYIDHYYLEVPIPIVDNVGFAFDPHHLHIWPRHEYMFIALPNKDKTMTGTLFAPRSLFKDIDSADKFVSFFEGKFPDAFKVVGAKALAYYFDMHPRGKLLSTKFYPYNYQDKFLLLGDAAHSMVPFYGQGLNCGLEDVNVLIDCLERESNRLKALEEYSITRKPDLDAIYKLSMDNYVEMRSTVTSWAFFFRKWLDGWLGRLLKERWLPMYTMISFRSDIPYSKAVKTQTRQETILNIICGSAIVAMGASAYKLIK